MSLIIEDVKPEILTAARDFVHQRMPQLFGDAFWHEVERIASLWAWKDWLANCGLPIFEDWNGHAWIKEEAR